MFDGILKEYDKKKKDIERENGSLLIKHLLAFSALQNF
jgi:hypothetical protein